MAAKKKKIFVLDTNVILHDPSCIDNFSNHDIIIPITVIEELDSFKKGNETINYHAREFARTLEKEIDYKTEATNMERAASQFLDDPNVYIPKVYREKNCNPYIYFVGYRYFFIMDSISL